MIIVIMILLSLIVIYFTRLLSKKGMRMASLAIVILYSYLIIWTYSVFIIDIADLGFTDTETQISLLHGSNIYHSFVNITDKMSVMPLPLLYAIVCVAIVVFVGGFAVAFHGLFEITKQICKYVREQLKDFNRALVHKINTISQPDIVYSILRLNCRANC